MITYFSLFQKVSFSYDAATVMFCSLYGFTDLINTMEPLKVSKQTSVRIKLLYIHTFSFLSGNSTFSLKSNNPIKGYMT